MPKYLLLKHYRGAPSGVNDVPMDQWTPDEVDAHMKFMDDFGKRLEANGEYVDAQALAPDGAWVRGDDPGKPPVTDGPFAETKDLIAGLVRHRRRRLGPRRRARRPSCPLAPGKDGKPIHEWLEVRPFYGSPTCTERLTRPRPCRIRSTRRRCGALVPAVIGVLVRRGADFAAAEDAVQEALVEAVQVVAGRPAARPQGLAGHRRRGGGSSTSYAPRRRGSGASWRSTPSPRPGRPRTPTTRCASSSSARTRRSPRPRRSPSPCARSPA